MACLYALSKLAAQLVEQQADSEKRPSKAVLEEAAGRAFGRVPSTPDYEPWDDID